MGAATTPDQLNDALDAMEAAAGDDSQKPGLIEVQTDDWVHTIYARPSAFSKTIVDGIRIGDIRVAVGCTDTTRLLTRADTGEHGEPFRDLTARPE